MKQKKPKPTQINLLKKIFCLKILKFNCNKTGLFEGSFFRRRGSGFNEKNKKSQKIQKIYKNSLY